MLGVDGGDQSKKGKEEVEEGEREVRKRRVRKKKD